MRRVTTYLPKATQVVLFVSAVSLLVFACAPVNGSKPSDPSALKVNGAGEQNTQQDSIDFSAKHLFVVKMTLLTSSSDTDSAGTDDSDGIQTGVKSDSADPDATSATAAKSKVQIGDNKFRLNIAHGSDLSPGSDQLTVTLQFEHSSAKIVKLFPAALVKQSDGSFLTTLTFKQKGTWKLHFQMTDKELIDEATVQIII
jgi:hypothetical protein